MTFTAYYFFLTAFPTTIPSPIFSVFSHVRLFATPWTVAHQAPLSMGFSRQEHWSGQHALLQGIFPAQGSIEPSSPVSPALQADSLPLSHAGSLQHLDPNYRPSLSPIYLTNSYQRNYNTILGSANLSSINSV